MLPDDTREELEYAFRHYARTGAKMNDLISRAVSGFHDPEKASFLRQELCETPHADCADMLDTIRHLDGKFDPKAFLKQLLTTYWIPPQPCLPGEGEIPGNVEILMGPVEHLRKMFGLTNGEIVYLMHLYCLENDRWYKHMCDFSGSPRELQDTARVIGLSVTELKKILSLEGTLRMSGILLHSSGKARSLSLDSGISEFLNGTASEPCKMKVKECGKAKHSLESFSVEKVKTDTILSLLSSGHPRHILLYGLPGAGKTEFSKALVAASGKKGLLLKIGSAEDGPSRRLVALSSVARIAKSTGALLVLDECDALLATENASPFRAQGSSAGKAWLNGFLDNCGISTIWISNDIDSIHESVKRRFQYSVRFETLPVKSRLAVWSRLAKEAGYSHLAENPDIEALLRTYQPSPADMTCVLQILEGAEESLHLARIRLALQERSIFMKGIDAVAPAPSVSGTYDPEALRCSIPATDLVKAVSSAVGAGRPLTMLFHGDPGTGKTELAKYLANRAGARLIVKRASDLLSKYVGESEKQIAGMFQEAAKEGAVLLLDEVDSFLQERKRSQHTWEVSQVNELLTQMEVFSGVFIACTNLTSYLDKAVMRRFSLKVHFEPLDEAGRLHMFERWFPGVNLDESGKATLLCIRRLSPGDFRTVHALLSALGKEGADCSEILERLGTEAAYRAEEFETRAPIGFSA